MLTVHSLFQFFLWTKLLSAHVAPPSNVRLDCRNLQNVLKWDYNQTTPEIEFKIYVDSDTGGKSCSETFFRNSTQRQQDLSSFTDPELSFRIRLTAVLGQNQSEYSPPDGITFSYSPKPEIDYICFLDMPSVNISHNPHNEALIEFEHPWLLYHQRIRRCRDKKRRNVNQHSARLPLFTYDVTIIGEVEHHSRVECEDRVCKKSLRVHNPQEKYCLQIKGELENMMVKSTKDYCVLLKKETHYHILIYVICSMSVVVVLLLVLVMVYRKLTRPSTRSPYSMNIHTSNGHRQTMTPVQQTVNVLEVEPSSPTPLLTDTDVMLETTEVPPPLNADISSSSISREEAVNEEREGESVGKSPYMPGNNLDDEDEMASTEDPGSGYESRNFCEGD